MKKHTAISWIAARSTLIAGTGLLAALSACSGEVGAGAVDRDDGDGQKGDDDGDVAIDDPVIPGENGPIAGPFVW